jgi:hypothetical protein
MAQAIGMPQFVNRLFEYPLQKYGPIRREPVELRPKAGQRDHGHSFLGVRFPEYEVQVFSVKIHCHDSKDSFNLCQRALETGEAFQDLSGRMLTPFRIITRGGQARRVMDHERDREDLVQGSGQTLNVRSGHLSNGEKMNHVSPPDPTAFNLRGFS